MRLVILVANINRFFVSIVSFIAIPMLMFARAIPILMLVRASPFLITPITIWCVIFFVCLGVSSSPGRFDSCIDGYEWAYHQRFEGRKEVLLIRKYDVYIVDLIMKITDLVNAFPFLILQ